MTRKNETDADKRSANTQGYDRVQYAFNTYDPTDPEREFPELEETLGAIADAIDLVAKHGTDSNSKELALQLLEEASMFAVKSITMNERSDKSVNAARSKQEAQAAKDAKNADK